MVLEVALVLLKSVPLIKAAVRFVCSHGGVLLKRLLLSCVKFQLCENLRGRWKAECFTVATYCRVPPAEDVRGGAAPDGGGDRPAAGGDPAPRQG